MNDPPLDCGSSGPPRMSRRAALAGGGLLGLGAAAFAWHRRTGIDSGPVGRVFVARNQSYEGDLARTVRDGLAAIGLDPVRVAGKVVLLKPSMVEPSRAFAHTSTHPRVVAAVVAVFRGWGAYVVVGEGPGHARDTGAILYESGLGDVLDADRQGYLDLNYEETIAVRNTLRASPLEVLHLPRVVAEAELIVSLPKLKTHHWVGLTASLKNAFGVMPGSVYGWPKNVLHLAGIPNVILDINAALPRTIAVVDAIDCMEGDGPIMGDLKQMGLILVGDNPTAVDASCARIMGIDPASVPYLALAAGRLGPIEDRLIIQRGEPWQSVVSRFRRNLPV